MNITTQLQISLHLKKGIHANGMTLQQYADSVISNDHPILDHDEFYKHFGSNEKDVQIVLDWATANNLTIVDSHIGAALIKLSGTIEQWNTLFDITMTETLTTIPSILKNNESIPPNKVISYNYTGTLTIPSDIVDCVDYVLGLDTTPYFFHSATPATGGAGTSKPLSPQQVANAYQFPKGDGYGGCIALIELGGAESSRGGFTTQNLDSTFQTQQGLPFTPNVLFYPVDNGYNLPDDGTGVSVEYMLDIAIVGGICPKANIVVYASPNTLGSFVNCILAAVHDILNKPSVMSISWTVPELASYYSIFDLMDSAFQTANILGISIFAASGDLGSSNLSTPFRLGCYHPASSPYVTSVGGTTLNISGTSIVSETVWNSGSNGTGGGISTRYTSLPSWQTGKTYKKYPSGNTTNLTVRGVPDVAANADGLSGYSYYMGISNQPVETIYGGTMGGTSAAAPLWAALICLLNTNLGTRFGFINPFLYSNTSLLNDIISGNNTCEGLSATDGYSATTGWDACTGLGSPIGQAIYKLKNIGPTYPKQNYGFRYIAGYTYPRISTGALTTLRHSALHVISLSPTMVIVHANSGRAVITASGGDGPYTYNISGAASGVTLNSVTGEINSTIPQFGTCTISATDKFLKTGSITLTYNFL